jgi:membrane protein DedA with SNARE-associated domain
MSHDSTVPDHSAYSQPSLVSSDAIPNYRGRVTNNEDPPPPAEAPHPKRPKPDKWKVSLVIGLIVLVQIGNWIASATLFSLIAHHPMWLVILQPTTKNLLLISTQIPLVLFMIVAVLRRQVPHVLWWFIGRWYGEAGLAWIKKRSPDIGSIIEMLESKFPRYGWLICLLYPHPVVCAMAGASAMRFVPFLVYTFIGIIAYVAAARAFGDFLSPVTEWITEFSRDNMIALTVFTVAVTAFMFWQGNRKGTNKIEPIHRIEDELDQELEDRAVEHGMSSIERDLQNEIEPRNAPNKSDAPDP